MKILYCIKSSMIKKFAAAALFSVSLCFAQVNSSTSAEMANRSTSLRYLQLAKNYAMQNDWERCFQAALSGNHYDKTVADLWYLMALSAYKNGQIIKEVVPVLYESLNNREWVDYNKSSARIFYADLLCSMGKSKEAIDVLNERPLIYSADAEYVRIKASYQIGSEESIRSARDKLETTRRIYPSDERFVHLFFAYEYRLMFPKNAAGTGFDYVEPDASVRKIADAFIAKVPEYDKKDPELEVYAAIFASGEQQVRLLKSFNARGFRSVLYPEACIKAGLMSESDALDYFISFMDKGVELYDLEKFYACLTDEKVIKDFNEYLNAYTGLIYCDTNRTLDKNLFVTYERGRPQRVDYDSDNDGGWDWNSLCDFGNVKSVSFVDKHIDVTYGTYPSPVKVVFHDLPDEDWVVFNLIDETVNAGVYDIVKDKVIGNFDFYVVDEKSVWNGGNIFDYSNLIFSINTMEKPSDERTDAIIRFSMLNGKPYAADYLENNKLFAHAQFTDGEMAVLRNVDNDGDTIFETTEIYKMRFPGISVSEEDMASCTRNIWGRSVKNAAIYLSMIQIDRNLDTKPDFTEEYLADGGKITTWDTDNDGQWDVRYTVSKPEDGITKTLSEYIVYNVHNGKYAVNVYSENDIPVAVSAGEKLIAVTPGKTDCFYWVGQEGNLEQEENVLGEIAPVVQGAVIQIEETGWYIQAVRIEKNIFAVLVQRPVEVDMIENPETERRVGSEPVTEEKGERVLNENSKK